MSKMRGSLKGKKSKKFIPNLSTTPNHICFKNYEEGNVYKEQIQILNRDTLNYHLSIKFDNPDEIKLSILGSVSKTRIDSGEDLILELEFRPLISFRKESVDRRYEICVSIVNANAKYFIPVLVLSPNPVVNFPKEISLPETAVNTPAYSNIFVLNYTNQNQKFSFDSRNEIKIVPDCKSIGVKPSDGSSYLLEFIPKALGSFREKINVNFENGRKICVIVKCNVIPINVFLNEANIIFPPTFLGMTESKEIHIVNNSDEASYFEWLPIEQLHTDEPSNSQNPHTSSRYVQVFPMSGEIQPNTITTIIINFSPQDSDDDENEVLREIFFTFGLKLSLELDYHPLVNIRGKIVGPTFQLDKKQVDIGSVYLGESRLINVSVTNSGFINGKVFFQKSPSPFDGIVKVSSKCESILQGETKEFKIKFIARKPGKFIEQIFFKVKNSERLSFVIQGTIKPLEISINPKFVQLCEVPICAPQMQLLLMKNELPFPVDVKIEVENPGKEEPLEFLEFFEARKFIECSESFNGNSSSNMKSISNAFATSSNFMSSSIVKSNSPSISSQTSPSKNLSIHSCSSQLTRSSIKNFMERTGRLENLRDSITTDNDRIGSVYNKVDEYLEKTEIVQNIVKMIFDEKVNDEIEKREIVGIIVNVLIDSISEHEIPNFTHFHHKNWKFAENPREVETNTKFLKLPAKSDKTFDLKVFMTPNFIGRFSKNLKLKLLMSNLSPCALVEETIIKIPIIYDCQPPELVIHNPMNSIVGYAESEIFLDILIENSGVDGFFTISRFEDSEIEIKSEQEKFHIGRKSKKVIQLIVTPFKSGLIIKNINLIVLGSNRKFPISIECKSLPPDIIIRPNKIFEDDLDVLVKTDSKVVIENRSPTKARIFLRLENENQAFELNPRGAILACKQNLMVTISKFFYDPGSYRDVLVVEVVNSKVFKIPIKCTVRKLPLLIEPSFSTSIDFGTLFASKTPYFLEYNFTNAGKNVYMVFIILKNWKNKSEIRFTIEPNRFELSPGKNTLVKFFLNAENSVNVSEEFTVESCSVNFPIREVVWDSRLKASVIKPTICFSEAEKVFKCCYGRENEGNSQFIQISNKSNLPIPVALKVEGEFFLFSRDSSNNEQKVKFDLNVKELRNIPVFFNSALIKSANISKTFHGKIKAFSLGKLQGTVNLRANLLYPILEISSCDLNIVSNLQPLAFNFTLTNKSEVIANFKLNFKESSTILSPIHEPKQENLLNIAQCLMQQKCNLRQSFFMPDAREMEVENILKGTNESDDEPENILNKLHELNDIKVEEVKPSSRKDLKTKSKSSDHQKTPIVKDKKDEKVLNSNFEVEISIKDIQKYFKQLTRGLSEVFHKNEKKFDLLNKDEVKQTELTGKSAKSFLKLSQIRGSLDPNESRIISVLFVGSNEAFHLSSVVNCEVLGGISQEVFVTLTNCSSNLLITKTFFDISNHQRWDEILTNNICVTNISPSNNKIKLINENSSGEIIKGYVKFSTKTNFDFLLDNQRNFCYNIKFLLFKGVSGMFLNEFGIQVNDKPPIPISFFANNSLPSATLLEISQPALNEIDKSFEYNCLRKMFKIVNRIEVKEDEVKFEDVLKLKTQIKANEALIESRKKSQKKDKKGKESMITPIKSDVQEFAAGDNKGLPRSFGLFYESNGEVFWREKPLRLYSAKMLSTIDDALDGEGFTVIDYPDEYPEAVEITNFIAQQGFCKSLESKEIFQEFKLIYDRHVLEKFRAMKQNKSVNFYSEDVEDSFVVVPLPLVLQIYKIDLGEVPLNGKLEKIVKIFFSGDQIKAALRTETFVPDLTLRFLQTSETESFTTILNNEMKVWENYEIYQNRHERESQEISEAQNAVKRCHSFDFSSARVHTRKVPTTAQERQEINKIYNEAMSTKEKVEKNCFIQSEIYTSSLINNPKIFELKITLSPSSENFKPGTDFDEIIFIDLHLGPQIPINIKATIVEEFQEMSE